MSEMLGEIGTQENAAKRGILTVIVVHKSGDMGAWRGLLRTSGVPRAEYLGSYKTLGVRTSQSPRLLGELRAHWTE